jgi:hypothetical protein
MGDSMEKVSFEEEIKELAKRVTDLKDKVKTEEATKHSFVMPFLKILGYDVFNPEEVVPEFTADIGRKKREKVDYAIMLDGKPLVLIEVKNHNEELDNHTNQLVRYFTVTDAKFALLTNGIEYRFFSDLEEKNKMDEVPFLVINLEKLKDKDIKELEKFRKKNLDINSILSMASKQKYVREIQRIFLEEIESPTDDFTKLFASRIKKGRITKSVLEEFKGYIKLAFANIINELAEEKINALKKQLETSNETEEQQFEKPDIVTTEEEMDAYYIVKSIAAEITNPERITYKDTKSYFSVLYEGNTWKWICRFYFGSKKKYIGLHMEDKQEKRYQISKPEDIYSFKKEIHSIIKRFSQ